MRRRPSARLLVMDTDGRVLLFRFIHTKGALSGQDYWSTPGGAVEKGETFAQAGIRELWEETGIRVTNIGSEVARREFMLQLADGQQVIADERYFLVQAEEKPLSRDGWTDLEVEVMAEHKWWSQAELARTAATVWPENLVAMLEAAPQPVSSATETSR